MKSFNKSTLIFLSINLFFAGLVRVVLAIGFAAQRGLNYSTLAYIEANDLTVNPNEINGAAQAILKLEMLQKTHKIITAVLVLWVVFIALYPYMATKVKLLKMKGRGVEMN